MSEALVSAGEFRGLIDAVIGSIANDASFHPDAILALSTGGFPVAAALAKRLGISGRHVVGIPAFEDETGDYHLDEEIVALQPLKGQTFLVVDDASNRGLLTQKAVDAVVRTGAKTAKSCVLVANRDGLQPDYVGRHCAGKPPTFFWEHSSAELRT